MVELVDTPDLGSGAPWVCRFDPCLRYFTSNRIRTMDELKEKLAALGLDNDQIEGAIESFVTFIKSKLPAGMEGMLQGFLEGKGPGGDALDKVKGFFNS